MAISAKKLFNPTQLGTSASTLYTVPAGTKTLVKRLIAHNTDTSSRIITLYLVPSGGAAGVSNQVAKETIPAEDYAVFDLDQVLEAGDTIQALADAASVITVHGSGIEGVS
jgi:hypothetical protein